MHFHYVGCVMEIFKFKNCRSARAKHQSVYSNKTKSITEDKQEEMSNF